MTKKYEYNKKWRLSHPQKRYSGKKRYYAQTQGAPNNRKPWTSAELDLLTDFDGIDRELAAKIGRSIGAIQGMRNRVKTND